MKKFTDMLKEGSPDGRPLDGEDFSNDVANPKNVERINSFLGVMGQIEYTIPEHALNKIRERLGRLALSFDEVTCNAEGGIYEMPLSQFGGRTGRDEEGNIDDDGISHRVEGGLTLEINHQVTAHGTHFVRTRIV